MVNDVEALEAKLISIETNPQADIEQKIDTLNDLAWEIRHTDSQRALQLSTQSYNLAEQKKSYLKGLAYSLRNLGALNCIVFGKTSIGLPQAQRALTLCEELDDVLAQAHVLNSIASVHIYLANYAEALKYELKALKLCREVNDVNTELDILNDLAIIYYLLKDYPRSISMFQEQLEITKKTNSLFMKAMVLSNISDPYIKMGEYDQAFNYAKQAYPLVQQFGLKQFEITTLKALSKIHIFRQEYEQALHYQQQALALTQDTDTKYWTASTLNEIGQTYQKWQPEKALTYFEQALSLAETLAAKSIMLECHQFIADIYKQVGNYKQALYHYEYYHTIQQAIFNEEADQKIKTLQVLHDTQTAKKEAEIYQFQNVALEQEINERKRIELELKKYHQQLTNQVKPEHVN